MSLKPICLEGFTTKQILECGWNDYVSIILKDETFSNDFDNKIVSVGEDGIHRMDYQKIMMPMIKAIQEQQQMIEELQDEVQTLKSMLNE